MPDPIFLNLDEFESAARARLDAAAYAYFASGTADNVTRTDNRRAYERIKLLPRYLVDVSQRDLSTEIIGQSLSMPVVVAPMAMMGLAHPDRESAIARACKQASIIMTLSTVSNTTIEDMAETGADMWFQLYVQKDRGVTRSLVQRAEDAGFKALVVTIDLPVSGYREQSQRLPVHVPDHLTLANLVDYWDRERYATVNHFVAAQFDPSLTWHDLEQLVAETTMPVLVKGILHPGDALLAVEAGAAGIVVSNHGGRQLDTVPATIDVLPRIVEAVDGRIELLVDGGIRRGSDVIKALALGAKAVMLGRPIAFALAVNGQAGVTTALEILWTQYDTDMALCGLTDSRHIPRTLIDDTMS